ncbi:MAG: UPF0104 family protein [Acidobacteria bacterium]|nr:UPF0104 family protein [Acidobacteriota bacterium]
MKYIKTILILSLGGLLAWWFTSRLNWGRVVELLREARLWPLILAAVLVNMSMFARSLRWQALLAPSARIGLRSLFVATTVGFGALFAIGRAGEVIRPAVLSIQERLRLSLTLASIVIERIYDMASIVLLFSISLIFLELPAGTPLADAGMNTFRTIGLMATFGLVAALSLLLVLRLKSGLMIKLLEKRVLPLAPRLLRPVLNFIYHLTEGLSVLTNLRELLVTILYTVLIWALIIASGWLCLAAFNLYLPLSQLIFLIGFGVVGSLVPTPGGSAGAYHAALARGYEIIGVETNLSASLTIVGHLIGFGPPFLLALYFLVRGDISLTSLRQLMAGEPVQEPEKCQSRQTADAKPE